MGGNEGCDEETPKRGVQEIKKEIKEAGSWKEEIKKMREQMKKEIRRKIKLHEEMLKRGDEATDGTGGKMESGEGRIRERNRELERRIAEIGED